MDQFLAAYFFNHPYYLWQFLYFINIKYLIIICIVSDRSAGFSDMIIS